jgi:methionyl-tRNA formyltransferase
LHWFWANATIPANLRCLPCSPFFLKFRPYTEPPPFGQNTFPMLKLPAMKAVKAIFMGTPDFAETCLRYFRANDLNIAAVYTQQDKPTGRGRALEAPPVKRAAIELGLPVYQPQNFRGGTSIAELAALEPEVIIVSAYGQILPQAVLAIPRLGCLNIHPSLLPRFRGVSPIPAAIMEGDLWTGVSVMLLDAGTDTGPVFSSAQVPLFSTDTTGSLSVKLARIGAQLVLDILPSWEQGQIVAVPQDSSRATYCRKLSKEEGEIDWKMPAAAISRRVRAFNPWPGAFTFWEGKQLRIIDAQPSASVPEASATEASAPGQVISLPGTKSAFGVATCAGVLAVSSVQMEGRKAMPAGDFLRGQRGMMGALLGQQR